MRTLLTCLFCVTWGCAEPGGGGSSSSDDTAVTDAETSVDTSEATTTEIASSETGAPDSRPDEGDGELGVGTVDQPSVGCLSDANCGAGQVCCTLALSYLSDCVDAADCHEGLHDACLTDAQCQARRPGDWSVCCHDLRDRNYCAPVAETCQPLVPCEGPADCADNGTDVCCTRHPYYGTSFCTNTFFAASESDCTP